MDARSPPTLPANPSPGGLPPPLPSRAGAPCRTLTDPSLPESTRPRWFLHWTHERQLHEASPTGAPRAAQHGHHTAGPLRSAETAWLPLRLCGRPGGAQQGTGSQGQDRAKRAPLGPQRLRTPPGPVSPAPPSDSRGDRVLRPGAQTLRAGERRPAGCRWAHTRSPGPVHTRVCTHMRAQGGTDQEEGPGGRRGGDTWAAGQCLERQ